MSYKPDEKDWMAYLYDEMDEEDRRKMDVYLLEHPEARQDLENLRKLRTTLSRAEGKEVIAPPIVVGGNSYLQTRRYLWNAPYFKTIAGIAASVLLIIVAGKFTGTQISITSNEFRLAFGNASAEVAVPETETSPSLSAGEVQEMIDAALQSHDQVIMAGLEKTQAQVDASIKEHLALNSGRIDRLVREASSASQEQIRQFVDGIRTENSQMVKDYFQLTSSEQKQYIENLLVDFAKYLQEQRNSDLQLVQTRMNSIEQNTDLFRHETEQILSTIITSVGNPNAGETKY